VPIAAGKLAGGVLRRCRRPGRGQGSHSFHHYMLIIACMAVVARGLSFSLVLLLLGLRFALAAVCGDTF
jgi:hypothetical protein